MIEEKIRLAEVVDTFVKSDAYKLLVVPLLQEIDSLKSAYDCKTVAEIAALRGEYKGLTYLPNLIQAYEKEGQIAKERLLKQQEEEQRVIDSTDL